MDIKFQKKNRIGKKGGGIALIYREILNVEWIDQQQTWETFEIGIWSINSKDIISHIHGIYRPPNSDMKHFLDEIYKKEMTMVQHIY